MKKQHVNLTEKDKQICQELLSKGSLKVRIQKRIMGLEMLDKGMTYVAVQQHLNVTNVTLAEWAKKYKESGLSFLEEKPRSGRPIGINGEARAKVTALACSEPPVGYARWSLRMLSDRLVELEIVEEISHTQVADILKKTNCSLTEKSNGVFEN